MAGTGKCPECGRWVSTRDYVFADHSARRGGQFLCDGSGMRDARAELAVMASAVKQDEAALAWDEHVRAGGD